MKILLTTLNSKFVHSNLAIRYLRAFCRDLPVETQLMEFNINQNLDYIMAEIYKTQADLVGFSCYIWNIIPTLQLCSNLKKVAPRMTIVLGGPEVSFDPENLLHDHPHLEYIVFGEGEETFHELVDTLLQGKEVGSIPGLAFRRGGEICVGPERPLMMDLDRIPSPYTDGFEELENRLTYYESSRGCPFNCQYCLSSTLKGVRTFSRERIESDLRILIQAGVRKVKFVDRIFNFDPAHALHIMRFLLANQGKPSFHFEITAHLITDEMLEFLKEVPTGLFQLEIGVQSTHKPTLVKIKRADDFARLTHVVEVLSSYRNMHLHLDLIAGLPDEDFAQFQVSFNDVFQLRPDNLQMGFLKLLKGSGIRQEAEAYGYKYLDQPPYEILSNDRMSYAEILELKMIEDLLETFYNSHKFEESVEFIMTRQYPQNPFRFFQELKEYWEAQDYHHRPHKDATLYQILLEFYIARIGTDLEIFREYVKFDFLRNLRTGVLPDWLEPVQVDEYRQRLHQFVNDTERVGQYLPQMAQLEPRQILKRILVEPFAFDLVTYREQHYSGRPVMTPVFIVFDYEERDPIFNQVRWQKVEF